MTAEEMERAIGFLLESQARHDAQIGELRESVTELRGAVAEVNSVIREQSASQSQLNESMTAAITRLADSQAETQAQMREMNGRLNALIGVVERLATGGA